MPIEHKIRCSFEVKTKILYELIKQTFKIGSKAIHAWVCAPKASFQVFKAKEFAVIRFNISNNMSCIKHTLEWVSKMVHTSILVEEGRALAYKIIGKAEDIHLVSQYGDLNPGSVDTVKLDDRTIVQSHGRSFSVIYKGDGRILDRGALSSIFLDAIRRVPSDMVQRRTEITMGR